MTAPEEIPSDDEIADLMDDSEVREDSSSEEGGVEVGIPPEIEEPEDNLDASEESFSMDDFDSELSSASSLEEDKKPKNEFAGQETDQNKEGSEITSSETVTSESPSSVESSNFLRESNGNGEVSEFRQTLANLSRQLEIDKLAFLHKSMLEKGEELPTLEEIAEDIDGQKPLFPDGDSDHYSSRPSARLEGWISGLSFGANRRAKKFTK